MMGFFDIFTDKIKVSKYAETLCNEFIHCKNAKVAFDKATECARYYALTENEIKSGKMKASETFKSHVDSIYDLPEPVFEEYVALFDRLDLDSDELQELKRLYLDKYMILAALNGAPHVIDKTKAPIPITYKLNEDLLFLSAAAYIKKGRKTNRIDYSGLAGSIHIYKGLRYRYGSIHIDRKAAEYYDTSDRGIFYITNQRLGYIGQKQFSVDIKKIVSIQTGEMGLLIYKQGRENPYMIFMVNFSYDLPCSILSYLLNK